MAKAKQTAPTRDNPILDDLMAAVAQDRDRIAFARLFDHFAPRVKSYMRRLGAEPTAAEDLVQDVMLTVWRRAAQFDRSKAGVATWIFTIARNRRIDIIRRERRPELDPDDPALVANQEPEADTAVEQRQHGARLRSAVGELPAEQARLLQLAFFEDKSHSAIAAELDLPLGTVKSRIRLAMQKLRSQLAELE
jgi:RNA polymerase sigma-70 factor (ECF subfamily)